MDNGELETNQEKRKHIRSDRKGLIKWSYFNQSGSFSGELLNFSPNGIYFETTQAVKTGAIIHIVFKKYFSENLSLNDKKMLRNVCLGEVKHSQEIIKDASTYYGVGIKYVAASFRE